jgi:hypothetical protein
MYQEKTGKESFSLKQDSRKHIIFYELKQKYPEYFWRLKFDRNSQESFSEDLNEIYSTLQVVGILFFDGSRILILAKKITNLSHELEKITEVTRQALILIVDDFIKLLNER